MLLTVFVTYTVIMITARAHLFSSKYMTAEGQFVNKCTLIFFNKVCSLKP